MRTTAGLVLAVLSLSVLATACSANGSASVEQRIWILESLADDSVPVQTFDLTMPSLSLADGKVSGHLAVNSFTGNYELSGNDIRFSPLASTRMAGPPEAMAQETHFLGALEAASRVEATDDELTISDASGVVVMRLTEALEG